MTRTQKSVAAWLVAAFWLFSSTVSAKIVLRIPDYPKDTQADAEAQANREAIRIFEERNPDIKIEEFQAISNLGDVNEAAELMALAGGTAPDVLGVTVHKIQNYIDQGFVQPIEDKIETWPDKKDMAEVFWPALTRGKHVYGVVKEWYSLQLMYRKDMFKEAGLDPEKPPRTWDELYDYAQKLTFPEKVVSTMTTDKTGQFGFQLSGGWVAGWMFPIWVWQAGGDVVEAYEPNASGGVGKRYNLGELYRQRNTISPTKIKWRTTLDSPESVVAAKFWQKLIWGKWSRDGKEYRGVVTTPVWDLDEFGRGKVAMKIYSPTWWSLDSYGLAPSQVGMAPLPAGPGGRANYAAGELYMINARVTDKAKRDAAWKYIAFKTSEEYRRMRVKYLIQGNAPYLLKPDELKKFGYTTFYEKFPKNWVETFKYTAENLHVEVYAPNYQSVQTNELTVPLGKLFTDPDADAATELSIANNRVNSFIYGTRSAETQAGLRKTALIIFVAVLLVLAATFYLLLRPEKGVLVPGAGGPGLWTRRGRSTHFKVWAMLSAAVVSIIVWNYIPLAKGAVMAFQDYKIVGESRWVFLDNFIDLFAQPQLIKIALNTGLYVLFSMTVGFFAPVILALLLSEVPRGKVGFRVMFYLPAVMAPLVVSMMWVTLFAEAPDGALNLLLASVGIPAQKWLQDPSLAMGCIVATGIWSGAGAGSLIYLAALKTIPDDIYDAADLDGCSTMQKVWFITLAYLKPLILINALGAFIASFHASQNIFVMTQGGPGIATRTVGVDIFLNAYMFLKYGLAITEAWVLGALLIGVTLYQLRIFQKAEFKTPGAAGGN